MPAFVFTAGSLGDILATVGLASQVVQALYDNRNIAVQCETLVLELRSLQQVLILTEHALERYKSTPLGAPLVSCIQPEVAQCHISLTQFSDKIQKCRQALFTTTISTLWRRVMWAASDEAASLSEKLSKHRLTLALLLITLNSVGFLETDNAHLGNHQAYLPYNGPSSRNRIKDNTIEVVDPLGDTIPISTLFCETWESFHYVVAGYCRDRIGQNYVEQGNYQIVRPDSDQVIDRSVFSQAVKEGQIFEMSIILKSKQAILDDTGRCPRCSHLNTHAQSGSWIRCFCCSGRFYVKELSRIEWLDREDGHYNHNHNDDNKGDNEGERRDEEITNRTSNKISKRRMLSHKHPQNDSLEAKYFRRITLEVLYAGAKLNASAAIILGGDFVGAGTTGCRFSRWIKVFEITLDVHYCWRRSCLFGLAVSGDWVVEPGVSWLGLLDELMEFHHSQLKFYKEQQARADKAEERANQDDLKLQNLYMRTNRFNLKLEAECEQRLADKIEEELEHAVTRCANKEAKEHVDEPRKECADNAAKEGQGKVVTGMDQTAALQDLLAESQDLQAESQRMRAEFQRQLGSLALRQLAGPLVAQVLATEA